MSFADIRALFETELTTAFQAMTPPVPVDYDNVQEEPAPGSNSEYVILNLSFPTTVEPIISLEESGIELIRGAVQVSCYTPRQQGMKRLEAMAETAMITLNNLKTKSSTINACVGTISGPTTVLSGDQPHALSVVAAPFTAKG